MGSPYTSVGLARTQAPTPVSLLSAGTQAKGWESFTPTHFEEERWLTVRARNEWRIERVRTNCLTPLDFRASLQDYTPVVLLTGGLTRSYCCQMPGEKSLRDSSHSALRVASLNGRNSQLI